MKRLSAACFVAEMGMCPQVPPMVCVPGILTSQTSYAATEQRLLWKGCCVASGLVPDVGL